jgi:XTP/dITP diphosphohydrolase
LKTFVATKNAGKLREMQAIFRNSPLEFVVYDAYADVPETEMTYEGNALLKARALAAQLRQAGIEAAVLADDSGLEVEALGGRPGIFSARYAGKDTPFPKKRATLLGELYGVDGEHRGARFVCAMALVLPTGGEIVVRGSVNGFITREERGTGGFGYDPIFWYPPRDCTFAELTSVEKDAVSHRRAAGDALVAALRSRV